MLLLIACAGEATDSEKPAETETYAEDADRDGWSLADGDCDDLEPEVFPGATELCNGLDDDCDGDIDDGVLVLFYADDDGDGAGDPDRTLEACSTSGGYVENANDCDDADATVHPGADELCDGRDQDCDGEVDEGAMSSGWSDGDGDGYGVEPVERCDATGLAAEDGDCDDADATVHPGAEEACDGLDQDCDGEADEGVLLSGWADADGDGYGAEAVERCDATGLAAEDGDCDDADAAVNPAAAEVCDGLDQDCDGEADDGVSAWAWTDADGDGYGDPAGGAFGCGGGADNDDDCDDGDADLSPAATERCDGVDQDCDGSVDEDASDPSAWYLDADGDGHGAGEASWSCEAPAGHVAEADDCDDLEAEAFPGATERCDGIDNDCDGVTDEEEDLDGDGWTGCAGDCDDGDAGVAPDAAERCDGVDEDCDGEIDEGAGDESAWYLDADGDGHGAGEATLACEAPASHVALGDDCDDLDASAWPEATERCDGVDNDCDGVIDEEEDLDGDGWTGCAGDCDDGDAGVAPDAAEHCDGVDEDCDGDIDEDAVDPTSWYADGDGDGWGGATTVAACDAPAGFVAGAGDCDDADAASHPAAAEACDGEDDDCDGETDEGFDADGDGHLACEGDCDDDDPAVNPDAVEHCDGVDEDCDGSTDEDAVDPTSWYADGDGDGWGGATTVEACEAPAGFVAGAGDCDDAASGTHPAATEACDGEDDDCDGETDEGFDADGDGHLACEGDCDDGDAAVNPDAVEHCDGVDEDCDGSADEDAVDPLAWYLDADDDGHGDAEDSLLACEAPSGWVAAGDDCDDADPEVHPDRAEDCDGADQDCDGYADDDDACPCEVDWYADGTYMFCADSSDGVSARAACIAYGYHLVRIDDAAEDAWLRATAPGYGGGDWWIGLTDELFEGLFGWVWGPATTPYLNWASGEPNNLGDEDCVTLTYGGLNWVDQDCGVATTWICEAD